MSKKKTIQIRNKRYDLALKSETLTLVDAKTKKDISCVIRELSGEDRDAYVQSIQGRMTPTQSGEKELSNVKGIQASLVVMTLFKTTQNGPEAFTLEEIQAFPAPVVSDLFDWAQELSGMSDEAEEESKNG